MSIQDDFFGLSRELRGMRDPQCKEAFYRIWKWACDMESQIIAYEANLPVKTEIKAKELMK